MYDRLRMPDLFVNPEKKVETLSQPEAPVKPIPTHSHGFLSAFNLYPDDVDFETRENGEKIILMLRKHFVTNFKWIAVTILLLAIPTVARILGIFSTLPTGYELVITLAWYLVTMAYAFESFLDWYFDVYFVTDMRVVEVNFSNLINKHVSGAIVDKVQDVTYISTGLLRTMFDFGDVLIQTASEIPEFDFYGVPNPARVAKVIDDLKLKTKEKNHSV